MEVAGKSRLALKMCIDVAHVGRVNHPFLERNTPPKSQGTSEKEQHDFEPGTRKVCDGRHPERVEPLSAEGEATCGTCGMSLRGTPATDVYQAWLSGSRTSCTPTTRQGVINLAAALSS